MRKNLLLTVVAFFLLYSGIAQESNLWPNKKGYYFGVQAGFLDFTTPQLISKQSFVYASENWTKLSDQSFYFGLIMTRGLTDHFDLNVDYLLASVAYPYRHTGLTAAEKSLLQELFISVNARLLPDNFIVVPYATLGIGGSAYKGGKFDALMPVGAGLQFRLTGKTFIKADYQYVMPVTERANYHFRTGLSLITDL